MHGLPRLTPGHALFLDFDGTLVDIASQPDAVRVEVGLVPALQSLHHFLQGALAIITGRKARCVEHRMANLGIDLLYQGVNNKLATLHELLARLGLRAEEAGFMGDDIIDLQAMAACGFAAAPADSHPLALQQAGFVSSLTGGHGAVREVCEFILAAQGKLDAALAPYLPAAEK